MGNKRKLSQILSCILYNANIKGILTGRLYQGYTKGICVPGLNCYSCPAAVGSCPLGALQSTIMTFNRGINTYVVGMVLLFSTVFGRFICGWLCPFGLVQELLYKIPLPKYESKLKGLRWIKYMILILFIFLLPLYVLMSKGMGIPAFCKYICPQGTLGGLFLIVGNDDLKTMLGTEFAFKVGILAFFVVLSIAIFRPFCRLICPLGAIYGLFNCIALIQIRVDQSGCTDCGICMKTCPMKLFPTQEGNSTECIRCGKCVSACPTKCISCGMSIKSHINRLTE